MPHGQRSDTTVSMMCDQFALVVNGSARAVSQGGDLKQGVLSLDFATLIA